MQWEPSCSMHTNGRSDMTKLRVAIRNFLNASKIPCSVPKEDQVSRLYMDLYSAAWSAVLKLTAFG